MEPQSFWWRPRHGQKMEESLHQEGKPKAFSQKYFTLSDTWPFRRECGHCD